MRISKILFILILLIPRLAIAEFRGYITFQSLVSSSSSTSTAGIGLWQVANVNRLNYINSARWGNLEFGFELSQVYENPIDPNMKTDFQSTNGEYRLTDFDNVMGSIDFEDSRRYLLLPNLDRISYTKKTNDFELIIGRQQISLGVAKIIAPTDIFTPFQLVTINTEERRGADAIRYRYAVGEMGEFEVAALLGEDLKDENNAAFMRYIHFMDSLEISPIIGRYRSAVTGGFDALYTAGGLNYYFESLSTFPEEESGFNRSTAGFEVQLSNVSFLALEYHYNGAGTSDPGSYRNLSSKFFYKSGAVTFFGRHYVNLLATYQIDDLDSFAIMGYMNLVDNSLLLAPNWTISLSDNSTFTIAGFLGFGDDGTSAQGTGKLKKITVTGNPAEFSQYGKHFFTKYIYYF